jgi:hypothetical protein
MKCMSSLLAREARRNDPQRKLIEHFFRQVAEVEKANKAARKMEKKVRWRGWSLDGLVGEHTPEALFGSIGMGPNRKNTLLFPSQFCVIFAVMVRIWKEASKKDIKKDMKKDIKKDV